MDLEKYADVDYPLRDKCYSPRLILFLECSGRNSVPVPVLKIRLSQSSTKSTSRKKNVNGEKLKLGSNKDISNI